MLNFVAVPLNDLKCKGLKMSDMELRSLGIEPKRMNDLNTQEELDALISNIKMTYYQDYKTAYSNDIDKSHFEHII